MCGRIPKAVLSDIGKDMGYSGADLSRFLGITTSAVNRLGLSSEIRGIMKYL